MNNDYETKTYQLYWINDKAIAYKTDGTYRNDKPSELHYKETRLIRSLWAIDYESKFLNRFFYIVHEKQP